LPEARKIKVSVKEKRTIVTKEEVAVTETTKVVVIRIITKEETKITTRAEIEIIKNAPLPINPLNKEMTNKETDLLTNNKDLLPQKLLLVLAMIYYGFSSCLFW